MPKITLRRNQPFSLDQTLGCGQVFRWDRTPDGCWRGVVGDRVIRCRQKGATLTCEGADETFIRHYFSLDLDLGAILNRLTATRLSMKRSSGAGACGWCGSPRG